MVKQFTSSVIVFDNLEHDPKVLLIHHNKFNKWMIPGGHVEQPFESPSEAGIREVLEETGIEISLFSFIHEPLEAEDAKCVIPPEYLHEQIIPQRKFQPTHIHMDSLYLGLKEGGELKVNTSEAKEAKWVTLENIESLNLFDGTYKLIKKAYTNLTHKKTIYNNF
ncbi:NUDIX hydrolase [Aquimarina sp. I32.4]|uniref:NUDIX hydrolase n=1 Tax=Aquimarina sp. I32.4 TaxID=2053903 RepID=UPI000CDEBC3B|nr:NUDIX domain-containing protein [Aquimarina sp. I32.4]